MGTLAFSEDPDGLLCSLLQSLETLNGVQSVA